MPLALADLSADFPLDLADRCVKCGLCLPHCPTYLDQGHEADSPRGRISLMQGLASGSLAMGERLEQHIDGCLGCRACERVCPAQVPYGQLLDRGRQLLAKLRPARTWRERWIAHALAGRAMRRSLHLLLVLARASGVLALLRRGPLARLASLLPTQDARRLPCASAPSATSIAGARVMLFTGCAGELFDRQGLQDAVRLLEAIGQRVEIPPAQGCCGAIHQHAGELQSAARYASRNLAAFSGEAPVLCGASGCSATLLDYPDLVPQAADPPWRTRVSDLNAHLLRHWPAGLALRPLRARVAVHTPCTLKNVLRGESAVISLLRKIPQLEIVELDVAQHCCGAAGSHFITQPQAADRLLQPKLEAAMRLRPDLIVSANIGCSLHLAAGLRRAGAPLEVLHPVSLLARQLG